VLVLLIAHLIAALLAPLLVSRLGSRAFYLLALVPAAGFGWALTQTGTILDGRALVEVYPWVPSLDVDLALRVTTLSWLMVLLVTGAFLTVFYKPDKGYFDPPNDWRRRAGGGPILLNMIHEVGNLRAIVGEIVAVQAFASNAIRCFEVEDTVAINLRFENGALGTFLLSDTAASPKSWEQTSRENEAYSTYPDEDCYVIIGTDGSLSVPTMRLKYYENKAERSWWKPFTMQTIALERADPLARQIEHFAAVIRGEAKPLVSGRDGLQNLRVTGAILEAAKTGKVVDVPI